MMEKCYDEGTLQAFLDNELSSELSQAVARHVVDCDPCAILLAEVEEETAFAFAALEQELNTLVPTQRLWTKINESIEIQSRQRSLWQKLSDFLGGLSLLNPQVLAFGSLLLIVGVISTLIILKNDASQQNTTASVTKSTIPVAQTTTAEKAPVSAPVIDPDISNPSTPNVTPAKTTRIAEPQYRAEKVGYVESRPQTPTPIVKTPVERPVSQYVDGEESYVDTIARLEKTVNESKDEVLKPSARFAYEKDMAVVNDTIAKMREKVKKNPKNEDAKQILFASYQNKIELLNSVNQRGELMASLR